MERELIIGVIHSEDVWHHVLDDDSDPTGDLLVDDLDYLKTYDFYWLVGDKSFYYWESVSIQEPHVEEYLVKCRDSSFKEGKFEGITFFNESNKKFTNWLECLHDITHHIAFNHFYWQQDVISRFFGAVGHKLLCEPYICHLVRCNLDLLNESNYEEYTYGKVYDLGLMKRLAKKFGPINS